MLRYGDRPAHNAQVHFQPKFGKPKAEEILQYDDLAKIMLLTRIKFKLLQSVLIMLNLFSINFPLFLQDRSKT